MGRSKLKRPPAVSPISARKRLSYRIVLVLIGLFGAFAFAELAIRVFDLKPQSLRGKTYLRPRADPKLTYVCYSSNPHAEFQPLPDTSKGEWQLTTCSVPPTELALSNLKKAPWCVEDRTSDQGLRDRHYSTNAPPGKDRLAMVGDSFVRGEGVPVERSLPKQLEDLLGPDKYEVINAGFVAFGTAEEVTTAQLVSRKLHVNRVVLVFIPNDIQLTTALQNRQELINDLINIRDEHLAWHNQKIWLCRASRVVQLVVSFFEIRQITRETIQWYLDCYDPAFNDGGLKLLAGNFRSLAILPGCRVAVVMYPLLVEGDYPLAPIHDRVRKMASDAGLPVLDLADAFKGAKVQSLQVHPSDHHPNSRAHAIAARAIQEWLKRELPDFLAPSLAGPSPPSAKP